MSLPKVYFYPAGTLGGDVCMVALAETGDWHLSHICSGARYGRWDLHDRPGRDAAYAERFGGYGDGKFYDLVEVGSADEIPLPTLVAAGIRNPDGTRPSAGAGTS